MKTNPPYDSLDTPIVLVDLNKLEFNIDEMQRTANDAGIRLRPHIKIHESALIAKLQMDKGACGIEVGPVDQAEIFAREGFQDIMIAHPFYGNRKLEKLKSLICLPNLRVTVVVDMFEQAERISSIGKQVGKKVPLLLKIDTGGKRYGTLPKEPALEMALSLGKLEDIEFKGIYSHEIVKANPTIEDVKTLAFNTSLMMEQTANLLKDHEICVDHVSVGASPTYRATCEYIKQGKFSTITEIHPGSCIIGDMIYVKNLAIEEKMCAVSVLASVISTSHQNHAILDVGSKALGSDCIIARSETPGFYWQGRPSFGTVRGRPDLWLGRLSAETSCIYYKESVKGLSLGDRLEIIPNNAIVTINIHDKLYGVRDGEVEIIIPVTGRGKGN